MSGVKRIAGRGVAVQRSDVDTDQIIPAAWLKKVERTGFGAGLFEAWRADPQFALNQPGADQARVRASPTSSAGTRSARGWSRPR
jgi:3-isopropylmalate/(R)-2-methylmalate dehydratase small subunit